MIFEDFSYDEFLTRKDDWLIWRNLGHTDQNGKFIPPISFVDIPRLPAKMLNVFFALDDLVMRMSQQQAKKAKGKKTR